MEDHSGTELSRIGTDRNSIGSVDFLPLVDFLSYYITCLLVMADQIVVLAVIG